MPTIRDIAKISGVSYPTVSHVLNKTRNVSQKTQKKVFDAIELVGYIPNAVARGLSRQKMNTIGIVESRHLTSLFEDHCHGPMIEAALIAAQDYDLAGMVHFAKSFPDEVERLSLYCDGRSDGLILVGQPTNAAIVSALVRRSFPFVCLTEAETDCDVPYVDADQVQMASDLAKHLIGLGHRRFAVLGGDEDMINVPQRAKGFRRAFAAGGIPDSNWAYLEGWYDDSNTVARVRKHLSTTEQAHWPTAILCMNDFQALTVISTLRSMGIECPRQMSVAGIDDARASATNDPPLTTMRLPLKQIARKGVELLAGLIEGNSDIDRQIRLPAELIVRGSTARPA